MNLFKDMGMYLLDNQFRVVVDKKSAHIMNYIEIVDFSDDKIVIRYSSGKCIIMGKNLVLLKMQNDEVTVKGEIEEVKV